LRPAHLNGPAIKRQVHPATTVINEGLNCSFYVLKVQILRKDVQNLWSIKSEFKNCLTFAECG